MFQVIRQVSCGAAHVVALSDDGLLQAWGKVIFLHKLMVSWVSTPKERSQELYKKILIKIFVRVQ